MDFWLAVILLGSFFIIYNFIFKKFSILENEIGLLFTNQKFIKELNPGDYRINSQRSKIISFDTREQNLNISGQSLITLDNISVKLSLVLTYKIIDRKKAHTSVTNFKDHLYTLAQIALRDVVSINNTESVLRSKKELSSKIKEVIKASTAKYGIEIKIVEIRDIVLPGDLKKIFAQVEIAKREALANLERARGEMATLRTLNNAAKMMEEQPTLFKLRAMQAISTSSKEGGGSLILNLDDKD